MISELKNTESKNQVIPVIIPETKIELTNDQKEIKVISNAIRNNFTIVQLARSLGHTVAETSSILGRYCRYSTEFEKLFARQNWPISVNVGHIYIGHKHVSAGENKKQLKVGDHVLIETSIKGQQYCEVFKANPIHEKLFYFGIKNDDGFTLFHEEWVNHNDIEGGKLTTICKEKKCNMVFWQSKANSLPARNRIIFEKGEWLGTPNVRAVVSVNSKFN